jgi:hypothetical protein
MTTATATRRLAAILAADVVGYSRLMGADEEGTHERFKAHLVELIDPKIREHHGRIVKTTWDGVLAEFASVVDAVRCGGERPARHSSRHPALRRPSSMSVLLRGSPGDALSHIHFECGGRDRDCLPQRLLRLFNPSELAQRGGQPNRAFVKRLRALGYEEGRKLQIDYVQLDTTNTDRSLSMAAELAGRGVDAVRADIDDPTLPLPPSFNLFRDAQDAPQADANKQSDATQKGRKPDSSHPRTGSSNPVPSSGESRAKLTFERSSRGAAAGAEAIIGIRTRIRPFRPAPGG